MAEILSRAFTLAQNGNLAELQAIVPGTLGVDAIRPDGMFKGYSLLHAAASKGHVAVVEYLLSAGATAQICNAQGKTPLVLARDKGHMPVVAVLEPHVNLSRDAGATLPAATLPAAPNQNETAAPIE